MFKSLFSFSIFLFIFLFILVFIIIKEVLLGILILGGSWVIGSLCKMVKRKETKHRIWDGFLK